jgi:capsular polysaccharide transport system ATP-binding protein
VLILNNISKAYQTKSGLKKVLININLTIIKGERVAILGRNGAGKSTLMRIIGGIEYADHGIIKSSMSISWPLGYDGGMQGSLTGYDNIKFLCRVYDADFNNTARYVEDFTELGSFLSEPIKTYSAGMKGRLNFALSMAFQFDCLLIDEGLSAGDVRFAKKCQNALEEKKQNCSILMVSHSEQSIRDFCDKAFILENGSLVEFSSVDEAFNHYNTLITPKKNTSNESL